MGVEEHKKHAIRNAKFSIVITTDSRDEKSDVSGKLMKKLIENEGYEMLSINFCRNSEEEIKKMMMKEIEGDADIIIFSGGTGISSKDITVDIISSFFNKKLDGFGELFRVLSMKEIGSAAMMSRACAGVIGKKIIFCIPGSPNAAELAMKELILKEAGHMVYEVRK